MTNAPTATRRLVFGLPLAAAAASLAPPAQAAPTQAAPSQAAPAPITEPLGIALEGWPYPGPVSFFPVAIAGARLRMAYMDFAPTAAANGRAIFLLHGKNFDGAYWAGPIAWLRAAGFRVVVPDQIGFNKSSKPAIAYTFELLAANTMALADSLGLHRITVFGHSTGGMLAVRLATIHPDRVEQLVLEDPIGLMDYRAYIPPQSTEKLEQAERNYTTETYRRFIANYFPRLPPAQYEPFVTWRMRVALSGEFDRFAHASAATYQMIYRHPVLDLYPTLKPPVLLTAGTADRSAPLAAYASPEARARMPAIHAAAQAIIGSIPNGKLASFEGCGHVPHLEAPDEFRRVLLEFLR